MYTVIGIVLLGRSMLSLRSSRARGRAARFLAQPLEVALAFLAAAGADQPALRPVVPHLYLLAASTMAVGVLLEAEAIVPR